MLRPLVSALGFASVFAGCGADPDLGSDAGPVDAHTSVEPDASELSDALVTAPSRDASTVDADAQASSLTPCEGDDQQISCPHETLALDSGSIGQRDVHFQVPSGSAPQNGWPVVIFFQGSFFSSERTWDAETNTAFGAFQLVRTFDNLLARGYAIVAPEARAEGNTFWDTNVPPWSIAWESSPDHAFMLEIFRAIDAGAFGPLDATRMYATGISSGGYMTSRMAVSYPGRFRALAVHSASYATCSGSVCILPELPADHPPTIFLHGERDLIAPLFAMEKYADALDEQGVTERRVTAPEAGHEWISSAVNEVGDWFDGHR